MNEKIYRSAQIQFVLMWMITLAVPFVIGFLGIWLAPLFHSWNPGFWTAAGIGVVVAAVIHLALRKLFRNVYLHGSAIYENYRKERRELRRRKTAESFENSQSDLSA